MRLDISADDVKVTPGGYRALSVEIECDISDVVKNLSTNDVITNMSVSDLLDEIGDEVCAGHFGSSIVSHFTIDQVLEYHSIEDIINHIGEENFKDYIRDIFIDKILK
jgi:hypothetical protein